MATPLTADQIVRALKAEGVKVEELPGWRTHNRNHKGPWGPVHGVMLHHTVSRGDYASAKLCYNGYTGLPGPLCLGVIGKNGTVYLVGNGRANHAGGGDPDVLAAVKNETYGARPPKPNVGNADGVDGNRHFYGFECVNLGDGVDPWPAVQVEAMVRASAALCRSHLWSGKSAIEHQEWSDDKSDPRGPGYPGGPVMRARIDQRLAHPASWTPGETPPVTPKPPVPKPGGSMSDLTFVYKTADVSLIPGSPATLYWTGEHADEPGDHGDGGSTVLRAASDYVATLHLDIEGLGADEGLEIQHVETDSAGTAQYGRPQVVDGRGTGQAVTRGATFTGSMRGTDALSFRVTNRGASTVTVTAATLIMLSFPV